MEDYAFCVNGDKGDSYSLYAEPGFGRIGAEGAKAAKLSFTVRPQLAMALS